jgi:3-hydroxybutyryl-CoA dehydrogenase
MSEKIAVLGTGTMGQGIAQVAASKGYATSVYDVSADRARAAIDAVAVSTEKLVAKSKISDGDRTALLARLSIANDIGKAVEGASVVIEAAPEDMALKVSLFEKVVAAAPKEAILGSNTSSLSLTELGTRIGQAHRTVGLHFFNPPPVMELLEIVRGLGTSDETITRSQELAGRLGKTPIIVRDTPGFATSRLGVILGAEAIRMLESGVANAVDIDRAMELGYRHPMGPLKLTDLVGLDVRLAILDHLHEEVGEQFRAPSLLRTMVRAGKLGKKSGEGFYVWKDGVAVPKGG